MQPDSAIQPQALFQQQTLQIDGDHTPGTLQHAPGARRRLAVQLAEHRGWCALQDLSPDAVPDWLDAQLAWLTAPQMQTVLAAIPHHPSVLWGLWLPLIGLIKAWQEQGTHRPRLGLAGVPGAGKTTLGRALHQLGGACGLRPVVASIDDYYLPLPERAAAMAANPFGIDRGPPGSHDLTWLQQSLDHFAATGQCEVPRFDKGMAGGRGDRCGSERLSGNCFVLEGWLVGARPFSPGPDDPTPTAEDDERDWCFRCGHVLHRYVPRWRQLDGLVLLLPDRWRHSLRWRLQAEARQRRLGKGVLSSNDLERLLRCFWASAPPHLAFEPSQEAAIGIPPVQMAVMMDIRRRLVNVGPGAGVQMPRNTC